MALTPIRYRIRSSGDVVEQPIVAGVLQDWFASSRTVVHLFNLVLNNAPFSRLYGRLQETARSRRKIPHFVAHHGIDLSEVEHPLEHYATLNAFFTRRLKPGARPFAPDLDVLCCPADGKVLVYPELQARTRIPVKGSWVEIADLLGGSEHAGPYAGGSALVVRLAPGDYHRFHFADGGQAGEARVIPGGYYSVNPVALERVPDLFRRNKRAVTEVDTDAFGRVACLEIGAFTVATIVQTYAPGRVERGQEKGFFQYGGSTLVLLFEPGRVTFDADLVQDTARDLEVHVNAGTAVGRRLKG